MRLGPINYSVIEFPGGVVSGDGFRRLLGLVEAHLVQILDLEFVSKGLDGEAAVLAAHDVPSDTATRIDLGQFDGASSGLLDALDIAEVAEQIAPGSVAAILVVEDLSLLPVIAAWESAGAKLVSEGPVVPDDLLAAIDEADDREA